MLIFEYEGDQEHDVVFVGEAKPDLAIITHS